jgi:hypothetical protein
MEHKYQYVYAAHTVGTDFHEWLRASIGDIRQSAPTKRADGRRALVLIGAAVSFLKFLPVVMSSEALSRETIAQYSPEALKRACDGAAMVIVQGGIDVTSLMRERYFIEECCDKALIVFLIPEILTPVPEAIHQYDLANQIGLKNHYFVVVPADMRGKKTTVVAASATQTLAEQIRELKRFRFR